MAEVKYVHQNFAFEAVDLGAGKFRVINRQYFSDSDGYTFRYTITENGKRVSDGTILVSLQPQQSEEFAIPVGNVKVNDGAEYFVNFEVVQNEAAHLVPANHVVAIEQFQLPISTPKQAFRCV